MGAQEFEITKRGYTMREAYDRAVEDSLEESGHQEGYSGTIASTNNLLDITSEFEKSNKTPGKFIQNKLEDCPKRTCYTICIKKPRENKNKIKSSVEHIVTPGTKKWILLYCVYEAWSNNFIASFDKKGDAVKRAREHTEKNKAEVHIRMEKKLENGTATVAKVTYKKDNKEEPGMWIFFGVAAC